MGRIALTGAASFLGGRLLRRLCEQHEPDELVVIDITHPPPGLAVRFHELDLTEPVSDQRVLDVLRDEEVETVVHLAFLSNPQRDRSYAHELESIGTLNLLAGAAAAGLPRLVMRSFTAVYGARGDNPAFLTEDRPLQANPGLSWVRDKLEAEQHVAAFARRYPGLCTTVLRLSPLLGAGVRTFYTELFDKRLVPVVMGYDPLIQLLHPNDAVAAFERALERPVPGAFNVVPRRPIPLVAALHLAEKVPLPVPHPMAYLASETLWAVGLGYAPGGFVDYGRFPFVADGARARSELGFEARLSSRESLVDYLRYRHPHAPHEAAEALP